VAFEFHRNLDELVASHEINVTPFIDVMLVLLIIFMVAAPLAVVHLPVDLPVSHAAPSPPTEPVELSLQRDLQLSLNDMPVPRAQLPTTLARVTHGDHDARIFVRADESVRYGDLMSVMDLLRDAGYSKVALVSRQVPSGPAAAATPAASATR
jgi:biopolymer transport protein ExbD